MVKCPICKAKIDCLSAYSQAVECLSLDGKGEPNFSGLDYLDGHTDFECPECHEELFKFESEAIAFLKGEKN